MNSGEVLTHDRSACPSNLRREVTFEPARPRIKRRHTQIGLLLPRAEYGFTSDEHAVGLDPSQASKGVGANL